MSDRHARQGYAQAPAVMPAPDGILQRKCACGQHITAGGECAECRKQREAGALQRATTGSAPISEAPPIVHEVLRSLGQPLDAATRAFMEPRFGHDFSHVPVHTAPQGKLTINQPGDRFEQKADRIAEQVTSMTAQPRPGQGHDLSRVRVHTDARAAESARAMNALAYTVGQHVVFGAGQYAPGTVAGRKLLAHELTHVIQQAGSVGQSQIQRAPQAGSEEEKLAPAPPGPGAEVITALASDPYQEGAEATRIRTTMLNFFEIMNNTVVGDPLFEPVTSEKQWYAFKRNEAILKVARQVEIFGTMLLSAGALRSNPPPVPIFTTCIALQTYLIKLLEQLEGVDLKVNQLQYALGPAGKLIAQEVAPEAWHEARPNMDKDERPRPGDIFILAFQDSSVTGALQRANYTEATLAQKQAAQEKLAGEIAALKRDIEAGTARPMMGLKPEAVLAAKERQAGKLETEIERLRTLHAEFSSKLEKARAAYQTRMAEWAAKQAGKKKPLPDFEFSHVGFFVSRKEITYTKPGIGTTIAAEEWTTFDGGQNVDTPTGKKQGAKYNKRIYDPATNEIITGEADQRKGARLVKGWIDVTKLRKKPGAEKKQ